MNTIILLSAMLASESGIRTPTPLRSPVIGIRRLRSESIRHPGIVSKRLILKPYKFPEESVRSIPLIRLRPLPSAIRRYEFRSGHTLTIIPSVPNHKIRVYSETDSGFLEK